MTLEAFTQNKRFEIRAIILLVDLYNLHLHCQQMKGISQNRTVLFKDINQNSGSSISPNHMLWKYSAMIRTSRPWFLLRFIPHEVIELNLERHIAKQALQVAY